MMQTAGEDARGTHEPRGSKADVFIIESLTFEDEDAERLEGRALREMLSLYGKSPIYYYIRTMDEFIEILDKFEDSQYRYLHISCHGSTNSMATTLDSISFSQLEKHLKPCLNNRRLFLSSCNMVNDDLAHALLDRGRCFSVIGPDEKIDFDQAAIFWASFYHLMFQADEHAMKLEPIRECIQKLKSTFDVSIRYFSRSSRVEDGYGYREVTID